MLVCALLAGALQTAASAAPSSTFTKMYPDKTELRVQLIGEGSGVLRVTVFPLGARTHNPYQDFLENVAPSTTGGLAVKTGAAGDTILSMTGGAFELAVAANSPTTTLSVNGAVVSKETHAVQAVRGAACLPPGWLELDHISGSSNGTMAATLTGTTDDSCLRQARSLAPGEELYGFGQVPQDGLSAVGNTKLLATSSRNQLDGPSHAPAPFYISVQGAGLAHGLMLNTASYSSWDLGNRTKSEILIHSPDKYFDTFLFVGPTPAAVIAQMTSVSGRPPLPPLWALGFKYHTKNSVSQAFVEGIVSNFSARGTPLAHVVIENYFHSGEDLAVASFPNPAAMVSTIGSVRSGLSGGCKVVLWLDPHVHRSGTPLGDALVAANCTSPQWQDSGGCGCSGPKMSAGCGQSMVWEPRCMAIWQAHVDKEFLSIGIGGFKLDQDDGDHGVGCASL